MTLFTCDKADPAWWPEPITDNNSWAYTRWGKITDKTTEELEELLSNGDVTITVSME